MHLSISGFLKDDSEDDSLKFIHKFDKEFNEAVLSAMNWTSLEENADGDAELSLEQIKKIERSVGVRLPSELCLFLGVRSGSYTGR